MKRVLRNYQSWNLKKMNLKKHFHFIPKSSSQKYYIRMQISIFHLSCQLQMLLMLRLFLHCLSPQDGYNIWLHFIVVIGTAGTVFIIMCLFV